MAYDIERYLNIRSARSVTVGPEGDRLAFLLDTTGVPQIWTVEASNDWPVQRTFFDERITTLSWSPERPELLFGMDQGGNERVQLFRLQTDSGTITPLTDHPDAKHRFGGWSHDGEYIAFTSNRRDQAVFDVYLQHRTDRGTDATRLYEGNGWLSVAGWSPSDDRLLVHEARASFDHELYVLDRASETLTQLTDADETVRYASPQWGPTGEWIYLATDEGADTQYLARLHTETGDLEQLRSGGDWNVSEVALDEETGRLVYTRNVDGYTTVTTATLTDAGQLQSVAEPSLGDSVAGGIDFFPDGDRFALTVTSRTTNPNIVVVDFETGTPTQYTHAATAGIPRETFQAPELVHYESFDGRAIPAFFTRPETAADDSVPVIVDIHGGPESQRRPSFSATRQYFLQQGYALFEPNVRGSAGYGREYTHLDDVTRRMDSVADINAGVEWLHDRPQIDNDRIVAMGGSYGGFMVLASLTEYPELWAAGVDIVGIANFITFLENTGSWRRSLREAEYGSLDTDRDFLASISPTTNIDAIDAPLFVLHGENDPRVPVNEARQIAEEATTQGVPVETLIFEDEGHGLSKRANKIEAYSRIAAFLEEHV